MTVDEYVTQLTETAGTEQGIKAARQALREYPESAVLWVALGDSLLAQEMCDRNVKDEAIRAFDRAIQVEPANAAGYEAKAWFIYAVLNDRRNSVRAFSDAIAKGGSDQAYCGMASALADEGREEAALEAAQQGLRKFPGSEALHGVISDIREGLFSDA